MQHSTGILARLANLGTENLPENRQEKIMVYDFGKLLKKYRVERYLTQRFLTDKLEDQGYTYTDSAVSKWERGDSVPPPEVVEILEDILEVPSGWLLKAAGYRVEAQMRQLVVTDPERAKHYQELSALLLLVASNLEKYLDNNTEPKPTIGEVVYGGWLNLVNGVADSLSVETSKIDRTKAKNLLDHLKAEFTELRGLEDWADLESDKVTPELIARFRIRAYRGDFTGKCPACPDDSSRN